MKNKLQVTFYSLLSIGTLSLIVLFAYLLSLQFITKIRTDIFTEGFTAFAGAFFAFIFIRLGEMLNSIYQRSTKHYDALVTLEAQLIEVGGVIHDDIYLIPGIVKTSTSGNIDGSKLRPLLLDKELVLKLYDLKIMNAVNELCYDLRRINDDMDSFSALLDMLKGALVQGSISQEHYMDNAKNLTPQLEVIQNALILEEDQIIDLMALVRVMIVKDEPLFAKVKRKFIHTSGNEITKDEIDRSRIEVLKDLEESRLRGDQRIKILKTNIRNAPVQSQQDAQ